ncbi:MAG: mechanosensitive ion channel domain-containing protein [Candidatus Nanohaloarchaea archaeon]
MVVDFLSSASPLMEAVVALSILVLGHTAVKIIQYVLKTFTTRRRGNLTKKDVEKRLEAVRYLGHILDSGIIILALLYLNAGIDSGTVEQLISFIPEMLSAILAVILGFLVINISTKVGSDFIRNIGVQEYFRNIGLSKSSFRLVGILVKGFLYLVLLQITLAEIGIGDTFVSEMVTASSWAVAFLIAGLLFFGFKDLFQNYAAGIYLKNSQLIRSGEEIKLQEEKGEIGNISLFSTDIKTETGYNLVTPNKQVMESRIKLKRTKSDLETLEDITSYFVTQDPKYCGPASAEMALEIFGYSHDQRKIGEEADIGEEGVDENDLMEAIEDLTDGEVRTAWVGHEKITDLADEYKSWFNDGALIVSNFFKPEIFPGAKRGHFVLSIGVEGDEILNLDPSGKNGGVYYVDSDTLRDAMGEHGHRRGYIVVAPEGTTAHWRIKKDLIYAEKTLYEELSKTLESRLRKIMRKGRLLKNSTPEPLEEYMEEWNSGERLTRVWKPSEFEEDASEVYEEEDETPEDN